MRRWRIEMNLVRTTNRGERILRNRISEESLADLCVAVAESDAYVILPRWPDPRHRSTPRVR